MDDNSFDKYIKDKVEGFQDNEGDGGDEGALAGFHARMDTIAKAPWYSGYGKIAAYTTAVILLSMLNYGIFSIVHDSRPENKNIATNVVAIDSFEETQQSFIDLKNELEALKKVKSKIDTVYIYQTVYASQAAPSGSIGTSNKSSSYKGGATVFSASALENPRTKTTWESSHPSEETISFLLQNKLAFIDQDGTIVLGSKEEGNTRKNEVLKGNTYKELRNSVLPSRQIAKVSTPKPEEIKVDKGAKLSAKTLNAIEKFKMNGVGFQYGPEIDLFKLSTNDKVGNPGFSAGIMAEFILSPSWRIETGIKYTYAGYKIDDTKDLGEDLRNFPNVNTELGELNQIEQKSHLLSFPVHLKYQHPISEDRAVFVAFGLAPQVFLLQKFEYEYLFPVSTDEGVFISEIESPNKVKENNFYAGTYDFSLGFEKKLDNKSLLQFSAFYNKSAGGLGVESRELDLVGLRSSIRFRVK